MEVKEAVSTATKHVMELFKGEDISNVGLEEVELDPEENLWRITIGFSRPWDYPGGALAAIYGKEAGPKRSYKVVTIQNWDNKVLSIKNREASSKE